MAAARPPAVAPAPYAGTWEKVADLDPARRRALWALYRDYYDAVDETGFLRDLAEKTEVLLVTWEERLVGFTTCAYYERRWNGSTAGIVFSGDTVVHRDHWGQQALAARWIERMGRLQREKPEQDLYWFLISKGHRTFRYLPAFAESFFPGAAARLKPLADALAAEKFGPAYDPARGVIVFTPSRGQLKADIAEPSPAERRRPWVEYFLEKNPGYKAGHELVCLCELSEANLRPFARRLFRGGAL